MTPLNGIEAKVAAFEVKTTADLDERILNDAQAALVEAMHTEPAVVATVRDIGRVIMKSHWIKWAAGAAAAIVAAILLWPSTGTTYAIEQTIKANQGLRTVHVRTISPPAEEPQDIWLEFEKGQMVRARLEEGLKDTFRVIVVADKVCFWKPATKEYAILDAAPGFRQEVQRGIYLVDPKSAVEAIYEMQKQGKVTIEIAEPEPTASDPVIVLTATEKDPPVPQGGMQGHMSRYVLLVDPKTKLARQRDHDWLIDGKWTLHQRTQYLEYNEPIGPSRFVLEPPAGAKVDDRTEGTGLPQGTMTDAEVAAAVVREHFEALIARDYDKAVKLYPATWENGEELRQRIEDVLKITYVRIVAIGEPVAAPQKGDRYYEVPFNVEIKTAQGTVQQKREAIVRPAATQKDRWIIEGGF